MPIAVPETGDNLKPAAGGADTPLVPVPSEFHGSANLSLEGGSPGAPPGLSFVAVATNVLGSGGWSGHSATAVGVPTLAELLLLVGGPSTLNASTDDEGNPAFLTAVCSGPASHCPVGKVTHERLSISIKG